MCVDDVIQKYKAGTSITELSHEYKCTCDKIRWMLKKHDVWVPTKKSLSPEMNASVVADYLSDMSIADISVKYGVSVTPIKKIIQEAGLSKPAWARKIPYSKVVKLLQKSYVDDLISTHISRKEICRHLGVGEAAWAAVLKHHEITMPNAATVRSLVNQARSEYSLDFDTFKYLYVEKHYSFVKVASMMGVTSQYLKRHVKEWGYTELRTTSDNVGSKLLNGIKNHPEVLEVMIDAGKTLAEIAIFVGCCVDTVHKLCKRHNIKVPTKYQSVGELQVGEFLKQYVNIVTCDRTIVSPYELDIVIPDKKIAIEYCGLYWHSDAHKSKTYHLDKLEQCNKVGYRLITIFEDEWCKNQSLVQQKLLHILNIRTADKKVIGARKCEIREIAPTEKNAFMSTYHIQGPDKCRISLGAFDDTGELIAVMTFSKPAHFKGGNSKLNGDSSWELNRFATHVDYNIPGIASKLVSYFTRHYDWNHIYSYADRRWSEGKVYERLGFKLTSSSKPNYWYVPKGSSERVYRYNFSKAKLIDEGFDPNSTEAEIMKKRGFLRIWDCGTLRYDMYRYA